MYRSSRKMKHRSMNHKNGQKFRIEDIKRNKMKEFLVS